MLRLIVLLVALSALGWSAPRPVDFNRDISPILSDKCFTCHGHDASNRKTRLRFDTEAGAKIALGNGRQSIVAGDPEHSELYRRIASEDKLLRMPPAYAGRDKLTAGEIELIRRWIEEGARWQMHWSLNPPKRPAPPQFANASWVRNPIDAFILRRLRREGLQPSAEAGRAALIRRVSLDVTGLPPTPAETEAFLKDDSSDAYAKVVDRLFASPAYAERMAFRWMEAARYGDTNGYQMDGNREMWRWRDWVIDAYRRNMPYDQFTIEQIAGDLLPNPTLDQRIATAFNRNHRTNAEGGIVPEEFRTEYVADRAETTSIVWLGLTVGCARCHDHKYDPITQKDFYRLFAYFNNVPEKGLVYNWGNDEPLIKAPTPEQRRELAGWDEKVSAAERRYAKLGQAIDQAQRAWEGGIQRSDAPDWTVTDGLVFRQTPEPDGKAFVDGDGEFANFDYLDPFTLAAWIKPDAPKGAILSHSEDYFEGHGHGLYLIDGKLRLHIIFRWTDIGMRVETARPLKLHEWQHVMVTYDGKRYASGVKMYVDGKPRETRILFDDLNWPMKARHPFRIGAGGGLLFDGAIRDARVYNIALTPEQAAVIPLQDSVTRIAALPPESRTKAQSDKLRFAFLDTAAPADVRVARRELIATRAEREKFYRSLPSVMVMQEGKPRDTFILKRGAYDNPGEKVAPGVLAALPPLKPEWPNNRLGLARWLVDRSNPLTARVTVNRFWQMYFGTGIVKTVDDFGSQGEAPVHPELLDWLATEFMDGGWDVKRVLKTMVMSATYRQSSRITPEGLRKDPENRLLARGPRVRLGPEMIRDQALAASGLLVEKLGGPSVKPYQPPGLWQELAGGKGYVPDTGDGLYRRSLYTFWKRTVAPPFMVNFDSPNRETCTVRENRTDTPIQALNLMNDETFLETSRKLAERMIDSGGAPERRIDYGYRLVLARPAKPNEEAVMLDALTRFERRYRADPKSAGEFVSYGASPRVSTIDASTLAAYSAVASLILNLDETVTK
ncbi:MAG: DUF1553 domain-containing protein [Acidobacteriota bacterium]|nr:DUF1553 domain-containing protein [Acidobacteriota bacterium]